MNRLGFNQFDSTIGGALDFDMPSIACNMSSTFDPLVEWLPKSSIWKKYLPTWHLVKSYRGDDSC